MILIIILIFFLMFSNSFSQLKEFQYKLLDEKPPTYILSGTKNPYLYIVSDDEDLKITTTLEPNLKVTNKGGGIFICEIIEKQKPEIVFHIAGHKKQTYKFAKILKDREGFWFEIKTKGVRTYSKNKYKYNISTIPENATIEFIEQLTKPKVPAPFNDSLSENPQNITVSLVDHYD